MPNKPLKQFRSHLAYCYYVTYFGSANKYRDAVPWPINGDSSEWLLREMIENAQI